MHAGVEDGDHLELEAVRPQLDEVDAVVPVRHEGAPDLQEEVSKQ